jgi:glutamate-1-semialdehyde 2,1-aminomutase
VWDVDGNEFIEYGMGSRAVTLGHAYPRVVDAASEWMTRGTNFLRVAPIEIEYAEALIDQIGPAEMVKFTKDGSTTTTAALKLARAYTGRDKVAYCSDQPFFSYDDWFIGFSEMSAGIPSTKTEDVFTFRYDDVESVQRLFEEHPGEIAGLILEPAKYGDPSEGFLHRVRDLCHQHGALFILDEMITGFRFAIGGGQAYYDVDADLSTFGKAMANGYAVSALAGKRDIMELGGLHHDREKVFLLSTTHGAEYHALAAGLETLRVYQEEPVIETINRQGQRLKEGVNQVADAMGIRPYFEVIGKPCNLVFTTANTDCNASQAFRTLYMQEMIRHGVLAPSFVVSYSHTDADIDYTIEATRKALQVYARALEEGVEHYLDGRPVQPPFRRYNGNV